MTNPGGPLRQLVDRLAADGWLAPQWKSSFLAVPRHQFIPDTVWVDQGHSGALLPVRRHEEPNRWLALAQADDFVITQVDDGNPHPEPTRRTATSSASMPTVVADMLRYLDPQPGHRVLEIGTGTGWNAALLAHRLGAEHITSIEIDGIVADQARAALSRAGFEDVTVVTGDGALGYPPGALYDRLIATCGCQDVPYAWVQQTQAGGRILIPWANPFFDGGLLRLALGDGGTACGRIVGKSHFMWLRDQRVPRNPALRDIVPPEEDRGAPTWTEVNPHDVAGDYDAQFAIGLRVPRCRRLHSSYRPDIGTGMIWLFDPWSRAWATVTYTTRDEKSAVQQGGPRHLWDEVEAAHQWWLAVGRPTVDRWMFTVTPECQRIELAADASS